MNALLEHAIEANSASLVSAVVHYNAYLCKLEGLTFAIKLVVNCVDKPSHTASQLIGKFIGDIHHMSVEYALHVDEIQRYTIKHPEVKEPFELADKARQAYYDTLYPALLTLLRASTPAAWKDAIEAVQVVLPDRKNVEQNIG